MTLTEILTAAKNLCSISGTAHDTFLTQEVNFGQADFCREINWPFLETKGSIATTANKYIYDLASNFDTVKSVTYKQKYYLKPVNYDQWIRLNQFPSTGTPRFYIIHEGKLKIYPATSSNAPTTTLNGAISSTTATTIALASVSSLEDRGRGIVDSEVVDWQYVDATNAEIENCTRGAEGTTAATHSTGATFSLREIEYSYYKTLSDLSGSDTSSIPTRYHEALVLYAASRFFEKTEDTAKANNLFQRYLLIKQQAKADLGEKQSQRFTTTLEDTESRVSSRDETWPEDGSLTKV